MKMHLLFSAAVTGFATLTAIASSFNIKPFSEVTASTPNIVRGTVSRVRVENGITEDGQKTIYTYADVAIKEILKGEIQGSSIVVKKLGGTKDGVTLEIPSSPEFTEDEDTVLFLGGEQTDHSYEVSGLELGKFGLEQKDGATILTGGLFAYTESSNQAVDLSENQKPWSVTQLRDLIKKQANEPAQKIAVVATTAVGTTANETSTPATGQPLHASIESSLPPEPASKGSSLLPYYLVGALFAVGAILFFKKRT